MQARPPGKKTGRVALQYILDSKEKRMRLERPSGIVELHDNYERSSSLMNSITQDMKYRQSLLTYAQKYGVSRASRKYNKSQTADKGAAFFGK